jgi:DNA-binding MarR family transcriptional regulator
MTGSLDLSVVGAVAKGAPVSRPPLAIGRRMPVRGTQMWQVTPRDIDMLQWIGRHGLVTAEQLARRFFSGKRAAYERIRKLSQLGLIERLPTFWKESGVLRLTKTGADLAGTGIPPANLVLAQVHHAIAVVDLVEHLLAKNPGATVQTEREIRMERYHDIRDRRLRPGEGRIPDAVLTLADGKSVAIEVDLTPKRTRDYERIISAYLSEKADLIWYYATSTEVASRIRDVVLRERADDMIDVRVWPS